MSTHVTGRDVAGHIDPNWSVASSAYKESSIKNLESRYLHAAQQQLHSVNPDVVAIRDRIIEYNNVTPTTKGYRWKNPPKANVSAAEYRSGVVILSPTPL